MTTIAETSDEVPFVKALEILEMAFPTEPAYSGGSSETLAQWNLGTTSVCPGRSGSMSVQ
jgi:hypothetical protein